MAYTAKEREVLLYSYYRDGEIHGSGLLYRLLKWWKDPEAQMMLSEHLADETRHAWLWTERIRELGATPVAVQDGYQVRIGKRNPSCRTAHRMPRSRVAPTAAQTTWIGWVVPKIPSGSSRYSLNVVLKYHTTGSQIGRAHV